MTSRFRPVITPVLLLVALAGCAVARAADAQTISFRAVCFDPRETETPVFFLNSGGAARKAMEVDKTRISDIQKALAREGRYVDFYTSNKPKEGELPTMTVTLPDGYTENLLFLLSPAQTGYRVGAVRLPPADFKPGATLLVNAAPTDLAVVQGGAKALSVRSGACEFLKIPDGFKETMVPIQIYERRTGAEKWEIAQSTRWAVDLRFRSYVFFYHSPKNGRLMLHGVTERLGAP